MKNKFLTTLLLTSSLSLSCAHLDNNESNNADVIAKNIIDARNSILEKLAVKNTGIQDFTEDDSRIYTVECSTVNGIDNNSSKLAIAKSISKTSSDLSKLSPDETARIDNTITAKESKSSTTTACTKSSVSSSYFFSQFGGKVSK